MKRRKRFANAVNYLEDFDREVECRWTLGGKQGTREWKLKGVGINARRL